LTLARTTLTAIETTPEAAWRARRTHLVQLLHLVRRQDLLQLDPHIGFQVGQLLLLIGGQIQMFPSLRREQVESATTTGAGGRTAGTAVRRGWTLTVTRRGTVLGVDETSRGTQCQDEEEYFGFHNLCSCLYTVISPQPPTAPHDAVISSVGMRKARPALRRHGACADRRPGPGGLRRAKAVGNGIHVFHEANLHPSTLSQSEEEKIAKIIFSEEKSGQEPGATTDSHFGPGLAQLHAGGRPSG
jgi:hypothetical protein